MSLFRRAAPQREPSSERSLMRRLAELEDDYASLERRFESLRGSVTGRQRRGERQDELEQLRQDNENLRAHLLELEPGLELEQDQDQDLAHAIGARRRFGKGA